MRTLNIIKYVFALIGIGMLVGAFLAYQDTQTFLSKAQRASGQVVDLDARLSTSRDSDGVSRQSTSYYPIVEYTAQNDQTYRFYSSVGSNPPAYQTGEKVEVLYQPDDPHAAKINDFSSLHGLTIILMILGTAFGGIGGGMIGYGRVKSRRTQQLIQTGTPIQAQVTGVQRNTRLTANGRHPYVIVAQWQDPNSQMVYVFESDNLWFDPADFLTQETVRVYIDADNPKRYHIDIAFLPKHAG